MSFLSNYTEGQKNFGLLFLRVGIGAMFIMHGYPKIIGGPDMWEKVGKAIEVTGIHFLPVFWGFMAALAEFGGGILLILGLLFRPACLLMLFTMIIATTQHVHGWNTVMEGSHAIEAGIVFFSLMLIGPGKYKVGQIVVE